MPRQAAPQPAAPQPAALAGRRAALWGMLAGFFVYPDDARAREFANGAFEGRLRALLEQVPGLPDWQSVPPLEPDAVQSEFLRLFELPSAREPCALYGGVHAGDRRAAMEELLRFYRYFGLSTVNATDKDLPDSLATVLEFLQFLCEREALAVQDEDRAGTRQAQRDLLERHLLRWLPVMTAKLNALDPTPLYARALELLHACCQAEFERLRH